MRKPKVKGFRKPNRKGRMTRHHNKAKAKGGTWESFNIFMLSEKHHQAYHTLFGLRNFQEAAEVLLRMEAKHIGGVYDSLRQDKPVVSVLPKTDDTSTRLFKTRRVSHRRYPEDLQ